MLGNIVLFAVLILGLYLAATGRLTSVWSSIKGG
jgi:hypothetical protein